MQKRIWITWERQRRSIELAKKFNCKLFIVEYEGILKYPRSIRETWNILRSHKADILFVQNPSMILAAFACLYKFIYKTTLIVDRHTTFLLTRKYRNTPRIIIFKILHRFTIKHADLTIVTNSFLADLVTKLKGRPYVLPDKLPDLKQENTLSLKGQRNILLISSFGIDEPVKEAIEAMKHVKHDNTYLYITGNLKKLDTAVRSAASHNVIFTGYLSERDFIDMLFSVDVIMALSIADYTLLCGCYEAISAEKPLITSGKAVLKEYFKAALFVDNTPKDIAAGIDRALDDLSAIRENVAEFRSELQIDWEQQYDKLEEKLSSCK